MRPDSNSWFVPPSLDESVSQGPALFAPPTLDSALSQGPALFASPSQDDSSQPLAGHATSSTVDACSIQVPRTVPPREGYPKAAARFPVPEASGSACVTPGAPGGACCQNQCCADSADGDSDAESDVTDHRHYADVCYSLLSYSDDADAELDSIEETFRSVVDPLDLALLKPPGIEVIPEMRKCAKINAEFLRMLVRSDEEIPQFWEIPDNHQVQERNSVKVRTVLRQFVRDWADEGAEERRSQYGCLLQALQKYIPKHGSKQKPRVLAPGSGLARLPFECARLGYAAQGNEFSYHMLQGSKWVLNETTDARSHTIFPFVLNLENRKNSRDHVRGVRIPDVCPSAILCPPGVETTPEDFSMCAGEFVDVYCEQFAAWDAVLTCFFLDTAKNIFLYIRVIADIIRPGGLWANVGPLLYHFAEQPDSVSIELSWEEIKPAIAKYFVFHEEDLKYGLYTTNSEGLYRTRYKCIFFAAIRNDVETDGESFPVYT
mmetsp:Transcript_30840/g.71227  ORF Transcript_30840/g.71227 Transcript_30840/m.71227 type:complete len:490 (-) Transcript_30840:15-1484(-)